MKIGAIVPLDVTVQPTAAFAPVDGDPALARVVRALLRPDRVSTSRLVVVAAESLAADTRSCLDSVGLSAVSVIAAEATATRRACLAMGLAHLDRELDSSSHVLIGDHRHPLASVEVTDRVIAGLRDGYPLVVPILPMTDTVKAVDARGAVVGTVERATLRTVQSPRGFQVSVLGGLVAVDADELAGALAAGIPIMTVEGDADAFAAELPADVELLDAITAARRLSN